MARKRTRRGYPPLPVVQVHHILPTRWRKYLGSRFDDGLMDFEREVIEHWIKVSKVLLPGCDIGWFDDDVDTLQPPQQAGRNEIITPRRVCRQEMYEKYLKVDPTFHPGHVAPTPSPDIIPQWVRHLDEFTIYRFKKDPLL
jgi:hypothetical protein